MKKEVEKLTQHPYLLFILMLKGFWDIIIPIFNKLFKHMGSLKNYYAHYDWFGLIIQIITVYILYILLKYVNKIEVEFNHKTDFIINSHSSFSQHFQANQAIQIGNYYQAYFHCIHAIKYSFESGNIPATLAEIDIIKNIIHNLCKDDFEQLKNEKQIDIENLFSEINSRDKINIFSNSIDDLRIAMNKLPQTIHTSV